MIVCHTHGDAVEFHLAHGLADHRPVRGETQLAVGKINQDSKDPFTTVEGKLLQRPLKLDVGIVYPAGDQRLIKPAKHLGRNHHGQITADSSYIVQPCGSGQVNYRIGKILVQRQFQRSSALAIRRREAYAISQHAVSLRTGSPDSDPLKKQTNR